MHNNRLSEPAGSNTGVATQAGSCLFLDILLTGSWHWKLWCGTTDRTGGPPEVQARPAAADVLGVNVLIFTVLRAYKRRKRLQMNTDLCLKILTACIFTFSLVFHSRNSTPT